MAVPRIRYAFGVFGDLRIACLIIFTVLLVISGYFVNKYIGMNIHARALQRNPKNISKEEIDKINKTEITVSHKGSFIIGSVGTIYLTSSIYGIIGILATEIHLLKAPMVLLPLAAFVMIVLIFYDLGVQETAGTIALVFWFITGFVFKIISAVASIYAFIVVFSYYMEVTQGPLPQPEGKVTSSPTLFSFPTSPDRSAKFQTPPQQLSPGKSPPPKPPPPRTPPSRGRSPQQSRSSPRR